MSLHEIMILFYVNLQVPRQDIEILPHAAHVKVCHARVANKKNDRATCA